MHTGRPVGEHGLYEWNVYEPSLDEVTIPLRCEDCGHFLGGDTLYQRLPVPATVLQPDTFSPSPYDRVFAAGARLQPFATLRLGVQRFFDALAAGGYAYLYWDQIDAQGHRHGPGSAQFEAAVVSALDALEEGVRAVPGALVLVDGRSRAGAGRSSARRLPRRDVARAAAVADAAAGGLFARRVPAHRAGRRRDRDRRARRAARRPRAGPTRGGPVRDDRPGAAGADGRRLRAPGRWAHGVAAVGARTWPRRSAATTAACIPTRPRPGSGRSTRRRRGTASAAGAAPAAGASCPCPLRRRA